MRGDIYEAEKGSACIVGVHGLKSVIKSESRGDAAQTSQCWAPTSYYLTSQCWALLVVMGRCYSCASGEFTPRTHNRCHDDNGQYPTKSAKKHGFITENSKNATLPLPLASAWPTADPSAMPTEPPAGQRTTWRAVTLTTISQARRPWWTALPTVFRPSHVPPRTCQRTCQAPVASRAHVRQCRPRRLHPLPVTPCTISGPEKRHHARDQTAEGGSGGQHSTSGGGTGEDSPRAWSSGERDG